MSITEVSPPTYVAECDACGKRIQLQLMKHSKLDRAVAEAADSAGFFDFRIHANNICGVELYESGFLLCTDCVEKLALALSANRDSAQGLFDKITRFSTPAVQGRILNSTDNKPQGKAHLVIPSSPSAESWPSPPAAGEMVYQACGKQTTTTRGVQTCSMMKDHVGDHIAPSGYAWGNE